MIGNRYLPPAEEEMTEAALFCELESARRVSSENISRLHFKRDRVHPE